MDVVESLFITIVHCSNKKETSLKRVERYANLGI